MALVGHARLWRSWTRASCSPHLTSTLFSRGLDTVSSASKVSKTKLSHQTHLNQQLKRSLFSSSHQPRLNRLKAQNLKRIHSSSTSLHLKGHGKRADPAADYAEGRRITIVGLVSNVALSIGKAVAGVVGNSSALVADAVHSLGDLVSDFVTLYTHRLSRMPSMDSRTYPYGLGKFEALGTFIVSMLLVASGLGIAWHSATDLLAGEIGSPTQIALWAAAISLVVKEVLFQVTLRIARKQNSMVLEANAWHHRSDAISSILAFVGVGGQMMGIPYLDAVAGIAVAAIIVQAGYPLMKESGYELVDRNTFPDIFSVVDHVTQEQDAEHVVLTQVSARKNGPTYAVDVRISVSAHRYQLAKDVDDLRIRLREEIEEHYADVNDIVLEISLVDDATLSELKKKRAEDALRNPPPPLPWEQKCDPQDHGHSHSHSHHRHSHSHDHSDRHDDHTDVRMK